MRKNKGLRFIAIFVLTMVIAFGGIVPGTYLVAEANHFTESQMYPLHFLNIYERTVTYNLAPGTVLVMYPGNNRTVYTYWAAEGLLENNTVKTIVMAGVGSSSLGTAAFAKQVANELGEPVAGIVTGWGDSTIWYYGTQGYYVGRPNNIDGTYYTNAASYKLYDLYRAGAHPYRVVGHSKGSLDIANALFRLNNEGRSSLYNETTFISFGIGVNRPTGLANYRGYLGTEDSLGELNTTSYTDLTRVNGAEHHTNPLVAKYLPVTSNRLAR
ncbi:hypothetical protein [Alkaliphilus transvaalensis]|uniref:hypothetical protein n=1 Tax=Alkaliphilus transvaalensis TaxID=114628 RepID=UPI00047C2C08|nr:hypothetical protein [Alkaliphilus transvaalensis]